MRSALSYLLSSAVIVTMALCACDPNATSAPDGPVDDVGTAPTDSASPQQAAILDAQPPVTGELTQQPSAVPSVCTALAALPQQSGDLVALLDAAPIAGPGEFIPPSSADLTAFQTAIEQLLEAGPSPDAVASLGSVGFGVTRFKDAASGGDYLVVQEQAPRTGRGTVVVNVAPARDLWIATPHADSDWGTLHQGNQAFVELGARALVITGANRCSSSTPTTCGGSTVMCGGTLRISDAAHFDASYFHAAHKALRARYGNAMALNLHGMDSPGTEAAVISNGTKLPMTGSISVTLRNELNKLLPSGVKAFSCNDPNDSGYRDLCGTLNVQGRYDNGSLSCTQKATNAQERFLHIEQDKTLRQPGNDTTSKALGAMVGCSLGGNGLGCTQVAALCP